LENSTV
jgi:hypothetical protein